MLYKEAWLALELSVMLSDDKGRLGAYNGVGKQHVSKDSRKDEGRLLKGN